MYYRERVRTRLLKNIHNGCNSRVNNLCNAVIRITPLNAVTAVRGGGGTEKDGTEQNRTQNMRCPCTGNQSAQKLANGTHA